MSKTTIRVRHPVLLGALLAIAASACVDVSQRSRRIPINVVRDRGPCGNSRDPLQVGDSALFVVLAPHGFTRDSVAFDWTVVPPYPGTPGAERPGTATVIARKQRAIVVGTQPGFIILHARNRESHDSLAVEIVERAAKPLLVPRDTTVRTGDTVEVQATPTSAFRGDPNRHRVEFYWLGTEHHLAEYSRLTYSIDGSQHMVVGTEPGDLTVYACHRAQRDSITIRFVGPMPPLNRNVLPVARFSPSDTTVIAGHEVRFDATLLNGHIPNGPWRRSLDFGDGRVLVDTLATEKVGTAFGWDLATSFHVYKSTGRYVAVMTVTDRDGRASSTSARITVVPQELRLRVMEGGVVRLGDRRRDFPVAILSGQGPLDNAQAVWWSGAAADDLEIPPVTIGRTKFRFAADSGFGVTTADVNGDGHLDVVLHFDRAALIRNGDLRLGRVRIEMTGGMLVRRVGRSGWYTPFRARTSVQVMP